MTSDFANLPQLVADALATHGHRFIDRVEVLDEVGSTQDEARRLAGGKPGLMLVASRQTSGRGRLGRAWADTATAGLAATFVLDASMSAGRLSIIAGLAACMTCEACLLPISAQSASPTRAPQLGVRWPNDVVELTEEGKPGRKLSGVLIERADGVSYVGIGINVRQRLEDWPDELRSNAVSLRQLGMPGLESGRAADSSVRDRGEVALALAVTINRLLEASPQLLRDQWRERNALHDQRCRFICDGVEHAGRVISIDPENTIELADERGSVVRLPALTTSLIHA